MNIIWTYWSLVEKDRFKEIKKVVQYKLSSIWSKIKVLCNWTTSRYKKKIEIIETFDPNVIGEKDQAFFNRPYQIEAIYFLQWLGHS